MYSGAPDMGSSDHLQLKPLAGGQEAKRGPGAEHLIVACSWAPVPERGQEGTWAPALFPTGRILLASSVISPQYYI